MYDLVINKSEDIEKKVKDIININFKVFYSIYEDLSWSNAFPFLTSDTTYSNIAKYGDMNRIARKICQIYNCTNDDKGLFIHETYIEKDNIEIFNGFIINDEDRDDMTILANSLNTKFSDKYFGEFCVYRIHNEKHIENPNNCYLLGYKASAWLKIWVEDKIDNMDSKLYESMYKFIYGMLFSTYENIPVLYDEYKKYLLDKDNYVIYY